MAGALQGRAEVDRRKQRLTALFGTIDGEGLSSELTAQFARYLCVLVSGHAEKSVKELVQQHVRSNASPAVQRYVGRQIKRLRNVDVEDLKQLIESFKPEWWGHLESTRSDELQAFGSIAVNRNQIAHGEDVGIGLVTVRQYFDQISVVLEDLSDLFDPRPAS
jgi:hypothetical protein